MDTTIDINNGENQVMAHVDVVNRRKETWGSSSYASCAW